MPVEYLGIYGMLFLSILLFANGLRLLFFCGYSRSFAQVAGASAAIAVIFGIPWLLSGFGGVWPGVALAVSVIGFLCFDLFLLFCVSTLWLASRPMVGQFDYVMVLGAGLKNGRIPSLTLSSRLDKAKELLDANPSAKIVVCGGQGSDEAIPESQAMSTYLQERGVSASRILQDDKSSSTYENMRFGISRMYGDRGLPAPGSSLGTPFGAERIIQVSELNEENPDAPGVVVVTSDFHALRSCLISLTVPGARFVGFVGKRSKLSYLPLGLARDYVSLLVHTFRLFLRKER